MIKDKKFGPILLIIFLFGLPFMTTTFAYNTISKVSYYVIFFIILNLSLELLFLFFYRKKNGYNFKKIPKINFDKLIVKPHSNLPFVYKKNFYIENEDKINYPLSNDYSTPRLKTNSLGFFNGQNGDREIVIPKPKGVLRINCLGASTTGNYLKKDENIFSYPLELEKILSKNKKVEVNNCGQGGYNSADILVRFLLQIIDTEPDCIILYHAHNDIRSYLTKDFESDYSNSRDNIGTNYWKFYISNYLFDFKLNYLNYLINKWLPNNDRYSLMQQIEKSQINLNLDYSKGLKAFERNIQSIITICKSKNIELILSTFCFYLHEKALKNKLFITYKKIVDEENKIIKKLASTNNLKIVDNDKLIEKKDENFLDTIHFSPSGMKKIAKNFSQII